MYADQQQVFRFFGGCERAPCNGGRTRQEQWTSVTGGGWNCLQYRGMQMSVSRNGEDVWRLNKGKGGWQQGTSSVEGCGSVGREKYRQLIMN